MSSCSAKICVNKTRNQHLVEYVACNHCPNWLATQEERIDADEKEYDRIINIPY